VFIWIYPLTQARVDQIEQDLAARRSQDERAAEA